MLPLPSTFPDLAAPSLLLHSLCTITSSLLSGGFLRADLDADRMRSREPCVD